jgi:hypothetical protein
MRATFAILWASGSVVLAAFMPWWMAPVCFYNAVQAGRLLIDSAERSR